MILWYGRRRLNLHTINLNVIILVLANMSPTVSVFASVNDLGSVAAENRTGKIVRVYVDETGNTTLIEIQPNERGIMVASDVELVATHYLSASQTAQMKTNIQGMTQAANLATALMPFLPQPFAGIFLALSRVSIFAQDVRYAGIYGNAIIMREYCRLPHTSYSHFYEYEIL